MSKPQQPPVDHSVQSDGRQANAAQPLDAADDNAGAERYPSVRQDDAVERTGRVAQVTGEDAGEPRSFDPARTSGASATGNPQPRQGAGDTSPEANPSADAGRLSGGGDPAEGKR